MLLRRWNPWPPFILQHTLLLLLLPTGVKSKVLGFLEPQAKSPTATYNNFILCPLDKEKKNF